MASTAESPFQAAVADVAALRALADTQLLPVDPLSSGARYYDDKSIDFSLLDKAIERRHCDPASVIKNLVQGDGADRGTQLLLDRSIGCLVGLAIGDAVGAPLEFIPVDPSLPPYELKDAQAASSSRHVNRRAAYLCDTLASDGQLDYPRCYNKFQLLPGQWTDDCAMALCLADSLLVNNGYSGGDCRCRYHRWWFHGYNNAFRHDTVRRDRTSVGLGGNIANSLMDLEENYAGRSGNEVPPMFSLKGEDAGNGSIMRLAPVPIRYHADMQTAMAVSVMQSTATHPGEDASQCCRFMAYFLVTAINRPAEANAAPGRNEVRRFMDDVVAAFVREHLPTTPASDAQKRMTMLLQFGASELPAVYANWSWRSRELPVSEAMTARGPVFNGYPVSAGYFGSYCMDGLAMALWALYGASDFADCILRAVNLLGDADTVGAIVGQLAGALFGYTAIERRQRDGQQTTRSLGSVMLDNVYRWDRKYEIPLRAALLTMDGIEDGIGKPQEHQQQQRHQQQQQRQGRR